MQSALSANTHCRFRHVGTGSPYLRYVDSGVLNEAECKDEAHGAPIVSPGDRVIRLLGRLTTSYANDRNRHITGRYIGLKRRQATTPAISRTATMKYGPISLMVSTKLPNKPAATNATTV